MLLCISKALQVKSLDLHSDVQGSALGAQAYRNLRPSLGAWLGLGSALARPGPRLC